MVRCLRDEDPRGIYIITEFLTRLYKDILLSASYFLLSADFY